LKKIAKGMHISIADELKKRFHAACALRGLKMSQVVAELIEQWLAANDASRSTKLKNEQ
jgi:antitoxin component of RelBE/YafQ-DinJ toxin-antitoxin module